VAHVASAVTDAVAVVAEVAEVAMKEELMLMETQSNHQTDQEEMDQLKAEEVTDKTNLEEVAEVQESKATEEEVLEPTKLLYTSKKVKTLLKKKRPPKLLNQNQSLKWKLLVFQLTISSQEKPELKERKPELLKVSKVPKLKLILKKKFIKLLSLSRDMLPTLRQLIQASTPCSDSKPEVTMMFHQEVAEVETEEEEEAEPRVAVAEDKMPNKPLELPTTTSQLCEHEDLLDLNQK